MIDARRLSFSRSDSAYGNVAGLQLRTFDGGSFRFMPEALQGAFFSGLLLCGQRTSNSQHEALVTLVLGFRTFSFRIKAKPSDHALTNLPPWLVKICFPTTDARSPNAQQVR